MDHVREGAFLAEVVIYDRLVIPVPPDPKHAEIPEDRSFAEKQWDRWERNGWNPKRQQMLLNKLPAMAGGVVAVSPYNSLENLKGDFGIT